MLSLAILMASTSFPVGQAALCEPGQQLDENLNSHGRLVNATAETLYRSGQFRADSLSEEGRNYAFEAADILRLRMNSQSLQSVAAQNSEHTARRIEAARADQLQGDSIFADIDLTGDSATAGGSVLARQIEAQWSRVLEEPKPPLLGPSLFPINTDAPPGSENIKIVRFRERGQAQIYNGGNAAVPTTSLRQVAWHSYFRHIVSMIQYSVFDQLAWDLAKLDGVTRSLKTAKRVIEELWDKIIWFGSVEHGLYGVTNFPGVGRRIVSTTFSASASIDSMIREFQSLFTSVSETSNGTFLPDSILIASKLYNFMAAQRLQSYNDTSLIEYLQKQLQLIYEASGGEGKLTFKSVARLNDAGGTGVHATFIYKNDPDCISLPVSQPMTMLPLLQTNMQFQQVVYMSMAGVVMPNVGANVLGYITLS